MTLINWTQISEKCALDNFNRQVYLGNQFIYSLPPTTIGSTSETPIVLLENPAANTKNIFLLNKKLTALTTAQTAIFRFYGNPTVVSSGTPVTPVNLRTAAPQVSSALVYSNPTLSSFGAFIASLASAYFVPDVSEILSIFDAGSSILTTVQVSATSTVISAEYVWYEI